jgi:hypothetical protein
VIVPHRIPNLAQTRHTRHPREGNTGASPAQWRATENAVLPLLRDHTHDQKLPPRNDATPLVAPFGFQQYSGSRSVGHDLAPTDVGILAARWIDSDLARRAGLRRRTRSRMPRWSGERAGTIPVLPFRTSIPAPNECAITGSAAIVRIWNTDCRRQTQDQAEVPRDAPSVGFTSWTSRVRSWSSAL